MTIDFNNFHGYFPGGFYRSKNTRPDIMGDLDKVLSESGFDNGRFQKLKSENERIFREMIDLSKNTVKRDLTTEEQEREVKLIEDGKINSRDLNEMLEPIYHAMVGKGYSHQDLIG
ncbi:MAG TPA: hypothetical protein VJZ93_01665 [Candidatus Nanoarchaeia archaeon]|nr:hypothetical protein [Candidatus Nanoarchaeia archaeon]